MIRFMLKKDKKAGNLDVRSLKNAQGLTIAGNKSKISMNTKEKT